MIKFEKFSNQYVGQVAKLHVKTFSNVDNFSQLLGLKFLEKTYSFFNDTKKTFGIISKDENNVVNGFFMVLPISMLESFDNYRKLTAIKTIVLNPLLLLNSSVLKRISSSKLHFSKNSFLKKYYPDDYYIYSISLGMKEKKPFYANIFIEKIVKDITLDKHARLFISIGKNNYPSLLFFKSLGCFLPINNVDCKALNEIIFQHCNIN